MKLSLLSLLTFFSLSAFSAEADKLLIKAEPLTHNGECSVSKFDVKKFNYETEMKKFSMDARERFGRDAYISYKWDEVLSDIESSVAVGNSEEDDFQDAVKKVVKQKKIKTMFSSKPGESCEESEYCSITEFDIYFKDGSILSCNFDYTT